MIHFQSRKIIPVLLVWLAVSFGFAASCQAGPDQDKELAMQIGQMLMVGFRGTHVDEKSPIIRDIQQGLVGGVILFDYDVAQRSPDRNILSPDQLRELTNALQSASPTPLFIAVDQEGGRVARLKQDRGFPESVSQAWLGLQNDPDLTSRYASQTASTLQDLGINLNLAPVVDVNTNPDNPVIGLLERSFSSDPGLVARHADRVVASHRELGVLTALKHFPGHGSSTRDSHLGFTDVTETWSAVELEPYALLFESPGADMVMTAHVFNAHLDPEWPATLSHATLTGLLRTRMGYDGVIISDDMQMKAITDHFGLETALEQTIMAGADMIIFGNNLVYEQDIAARAGGVILELVKQGRIPEKRINESFARIIKLKKDLQEKGDRSS
ncbi:glycoside hydrolase family 3 protein [Desulfonatronovibrio hydrogenovorans]|uniref:glycoside hydrolase family 3 protein n=1 Tax=Desulfonatronovibrio hydrogenovorans TaxID=53245 RepID=UPI00054F51F8|nr:glycoside hydrolase family 3 protein [Desulfonatronovibrio hydrogenovorans]